MDRSKAQQILALGVSYEREYTWGSDTTSFPGPYGRDMRVFLEAYNTLAQPGDHAPKLLFNMHKLMRSIQNHGGRISHIYADRLVYIRRDGVKVTTYYMNL
jgi:hypothetical protein